VTIVDAYAHVGLPRFIAIDDYRALMAEANIDAAVLVAFGACADLRRIHSACKAYPERFRAVGVPLGRDRCEVESFLSAQLAAGFAGIRVEPRHIREQPWILDLVWRHDGFVYAVGDLSAEEDATTLLRALNSGEGRLVVAPHMAGCGRGRAEEPRGAWDELLGHERFAVIMSRQGAYPAAIAASWAQVLVARVGLRRLMWGSEVPVLFWRDESLFDALHWYDQLALAPGLRRDFLAANATRLLFERPVEVRPLNLPFEPVTRQDSVPAPVFPAGQFFAPETVGRLIHDWLRSGGPNDTKLSGHIEGLLSKILGPVDPGQPDESASAH
jgi:hypothetical protein